MSTELQQTDDVVLAEAAAWIARLQGSGRTTAAEAAFREWLAADRAHARAFSRATEVWEIIPGAVRSLAQAPQGRAVPYAPERRAPMALAACVALALVGAAALFIALRPASYVTAVGQQQTVFLEDGSRISLNTDSRLTVHYSGSERRLQLVRGEALFEVVRDPARPFVVDAGGERFRALGTTFLVRKSPATVAVTLVEGQVEVAEQPQRGKAVRLAPGERVTVREDAGLTRDRPNLEALLAWRDGKLIFDDVSLLDAVAEINRYGGPNLVVAEPVLAELRVSGVFAVRAPHEFASTMAQLHKLHVRRSGRQLMLER